MKDLSQRLEKKRMNDHIIWTICSDQSSSARIVRGGPFGPIVFSFFGNFIPVGWIV